MMLDLVRQLIAEYALADRKHELTHWVMYCLKLTYTEVCTVQKRILPEEMKIIHQGCKALSKGMPLAYLIKSCEWNDQIWQVSPDVLIPRPETKVLLDAVLSDEREYIRVLELGTGSGILAVSVANQRPSWTVEAVERSLKALEVAKKNGLGVDVVWHHCDWKDLRMSKVDMVFSNPPYIRKNDEHLSSLSYEPIDALVSGETGLECFEDIASLSQKWLNPAGVLWLEHGYDQADDVKQILDQKGFIKVMQMKDDHGWVRVTGAIKV